MSSNRIAPYVTSFVREYMPVVRGYSQETCETYSHALRLLFSFAAEKLRVRPSDLRLEQIDADLVLAFLLHIEDDRGGSATTRNARLAAVKAFMRFVETREPGALEQVRRIDEIPAKRRDLPLVKHLTMKEVHSILEAPNLSIRAGIRDRAMLHLCFACGLRVSELVGLQLGSVSLGATASIHVMGKGRRERQLPLWRETARDLRAWLAVRGAVRAPELFVNAAGGTMTREGFEYVLSKHAQAAANKCPSLQGRKVTPHQLRHSCAMVMLHATHDIRKVAIWLGHAHTRTTEVYLRADSDEKLEAMEAVLPPELRRGRFRVADALIADLLASNKVEPRGAGLNSNRHARSASNTSPHPSSVSE